MPVSLGRWPSLADYLGQRELAYFKQIFFRDIKPLHGGRLQASQGMDWRWPRNARGKSFGRWRRNTDLKASKQNQPFHDFSLPTR